MSEEWVGDDYWNGFPAAADRETARQKARETAQRVHDHLLREWEVKHKLLQRTKASAGGGRWLRR